MLNTTCLTRFSLTFIFVSLVASFSWSFAQGKHPIIQRIIKKDPGIFIFKQKKTSPDKFTVVAAVDKQNHMSYFVSRYGDVVDSIPIADGDYNLIETQQTTAFDHFDALRKKQFDLIRIAKEQILKTGDLDPNWEYKDLASSLLLKSDTDSTKKIASLNKYRDYITLKKWLVNSPNPNDFDDYSEQPEVANTFTIFKNNGSAPLDSSIIAKAVFMENFKRPVNRDLVFSLGIGYNHSEWFRNKKYELTDHRGNVMAEITDGRSQHSSDGKTVDHYEAEVVGARDYYAFGMQQPGRSWQLGDNYRYGFNGKENDQESGWQDYGMRMYSGKLGRFFSVDPLTGSFPMLTPYQFASNRPIDGIDLDGLEYVSFHHYFNGAVSKTEFYKMTDKEIKRLGGTSASFHNSVAYGALGKGIIHYYYDEQGNYSKPPNKEMWQNSIANDLKFHGLYSGPKSVTHDGYQDSERYNFNLQPIDWGDAIAKRHDRDYALVAGKGYAGFLEDIRTVQADRDMVDRIDQIAAAFFNPLKSYKVDGVETPFRTSYSTELDLTLLGQRQVINALAIYKQWKVDNKLGNKDLYKDNRDMFKKAHPGISIIIDQVKNK